MKFNGNINFNAQHSPMGAFMSFTCGHFGTRGGIGVQIGKPANQDLYIGIKEGDRFSDVPLKCLPFFQSLRGAGAGAADFQVEQAGPAEQNVAPKVVAYEREQIERHYGWATDAWKTDDFTFTIYTPFGEIPEPTDCDPAGLRAALVPAVIAELFVDNSAGTETKTAFFAMNFNEAGWRPLSSCGSEFVAFGLRRSIGVIGTMLDGDGNAGAPTLFCRWSPDGGLINGVPHLLGSCPGLLVEVPAGETRTLRLALGCHLDGIVTTGIEGRYLYARSYSSIEDVLTTAMEGAEDLIDRSRALDEELEASRLSQDQQFLIAHATRSYYGSTQLLDVGGQPFWVVNEGEYCMMNTLDLTVDQVFWELKHNPWLVRNQLDNFVRYYSYVDEVKARDVAPGTPLRRAEDRLPGGISFCHDMGAHNNFSPLGHSSYELPELTGCFSYMTAEQLCNWILTAACYVGKTNDERWLKQNAATIRACLESLNARCGELGFVQFDSSRCGEAGSEITTYDSLDHSLAQARNNIYMAVKCWASYHVLSMMLGAAGCEEAATNAYAAAMRGAANVASAIEGDVYPAVFEPENPGYGSRILPAIEGLLYVHILAGTDLDGGGTREVTWNECGPMLDALKRHTLALLNDPKKRNLFADGGIKLSSTSNNSWMSKIALFQHVCREVYELDDDEKIRELFRQADAAHVKWQTDGSGYWACSDQFVSGVAKGSRYYPRIITTALWLEGRRVMLNINGQAAHNGAGNGQSSNGKHSSTM